MKYIRQKCLHCDHYNLLVRRPLNAVWHASKPNQLLHADFLMIYEGTYLLVLVIDFTRMMSLTYTTPASSTVMVDALLQWKANHGLQGQFLLMTDKGSYFTAQIVESLEKQLPFNHVYFIAYAPWTNGAAEVANRNALRVIRSLCSQYAIDSARWQNG